MRRQDPLCTSRRDAQPSAKPEARRRQQALPPRARPRFSGQSRQLLLAADQAAASEIHSRNDVLQSRLHQHPDQQLLHRALRAVHHGPQLPVQLHRRTGRWRHQEHRYRRRAHQLQAVFPTGTRFRMCAAQSARQKFLQQQPSLALRQSLSPKPPQPMPLHRSERNQPLHQQRPRLRATWPGEPFQQFHRARHQATPIA